MLGSGLGRVRDPIEVRCGLCEFEIYSLSEFVRWLDWVTSSRERILRVYTVLLSLFLLWFVVCVFSLESFSRPDYFKPNDLIHTMEYQIALNPKEDWGADREGMISRWIDSMNNHSSLLTLTREDASETIFQQYHMLGYVCDLPGANIRVRYYWNTNTTVIGIKSSGIGVKNWECSLPYWPSEDLLQRSRQKCEEDYHPCFNKFTRGTSVRFPGQKPLDTCQDLVDIFPGAFRNIPEQHLERYIRVRKYCNWWQLKWKGVLGKWTSYDITFDVRYCASASMIESGTFPIVNGEWSLRSFSEDGQPWEKDVLQDLRDLFYHLVLEYDEYVDHKTCAEQHFGGKRIRMIGGQNKEYEEDYQDVDV